MIFFVSSTFEASAVNPQSCQVRKCNAETILDLYRDDRLVRKNVIEIATLGSTTPAR